MLQHWLWSFFLCIHAMVAPGTMLTLKVAPLTPSVCTGKVDGRMPARAYLLWRGRERFSAFVKTKRST